MPPPMTVTSKLSIREGREIGVFHGGSILRKGVKSVDLFNASMLGRGDPPFLDGYDELQRQSGDRHLCFRRCWILCKYGAMMSQVWLG